MTRGRTVRRAVLATAAVAGAVGGTAAAAQARRPRLPAPVPNPQPDPHAALRPVPREAPVPLLSQSASAAQPTGWEPWEPARQYLYDYDAPVRVPTPLRCPAAAPSTGLRRRLVTAATKAACGAVTLAAVVVLPTGAGVQGPEQPPWPAQAVTGSGPAVQVLGVPAGESSPPGVRLVAQSTVVTALLQQAPQYGGSSLPPIPATVLAAYQAAAVTSDREAPGCNLSWSVLAGIGRIESGHAVGAGAGVPGWSGEASPPIFGPVLDGGPGRALVPDTDGGRLDGDPRFDRAVGPMQFLPATWAVYGADGDGNGTRDPQNIWDAALAAGTFLCDGGADLQNPAQLSAALLRYNDATWYVRAVLASATGYLAASYGASQSAYAYAALAFTYARLGDPYAWGGSGPLYDCSGLLQAAYGSTGIPLARTAEQQWQQVPHVDATRLLPGDLVFFDTGEFQPGLPGHVGIYAGAGMMVDDPHAGSFVRIEPVAGFGAVVGAARPALLLPAVGAPAPSIGFPLTQSPSVLATAAAPAAPVTPVTPAVTPTSTPTSTPAATPSPASTGAAPVTSGAATAPSPARSLDPSPDATSSVGPSPAVADAPSAEPTDPATPQLLPTPALTTAADGLVNAPLITPAPPSQQTTPVLTVGPSAPATG